MKSVAFRRVQGTCGVEAPVRLIALLLSLSLSALAAPAPGSAPAAVQAANDRVRAALDRYFKARPGPAKEKARAEAREAVGALLDFQAIAQATMGKHWAQLTAEQRVRYTNALRGAMEANYLSKMQQGEVDISKVRNEILGETRQGDKVLVKTRVVTGKDSAEVDYVMERTKKGWKAVDVVTRQQRACSANFLIAQAPDLAVDLEAAPDSIAEIPPTLGAAVHTNHFLQPEKIGMDAVLHLQALILNFEKEIFCAENIRISSRRDSRSFVFFLHEEFWNLAFKASR